MMPALQINFGAAPATRGRAAGALMLLLAALGAAGTAHEHEQLSQALERLQLQQTRLQNRVEGGRQSATATLPPDAAMQRRLLQARAVVEPLAVPWDGLFTALESVPTRGVQIQELVPDAQARTLRIGGQAKDLPTALAYMERLAEQPLLGQVHLVSSQPGTGEGSPLLSFALQATWRLQ